MQAIAEAAVLGQKAGLNRSVLSDVLSQTAVIAPAHLGKLGRAAIHEYSPQFPVAPDEQRFSAHSRYGPYIRRCAHACDCSSLSDQQLYAAQRRTRRFF